MYWHVEYYDNWDRIDHNAVVSSFEELASLAQGRTFCIMGEATQQEYNNYKETNNA